MIEFLRFIMALYIVSFHIHSSTLNGRYFRHGNVAVSFFFLITGFQLAKQCMSTNVLSIEDAAVYSVKKTWRRFKKIALPFFLIWICCFFVRNYKLLATPLKFAKKIWDGVPSLLFIRSFFNEGADYITGAWYLSAMFTAILIILPLMVYRPKFYLNIFAPAFGFLAAGFVAFSFKNNFGSVMKYLGPFTKGLWWAFFSINLGGWCYTISSKLSKKIKKTGWSAFLFSLLEICLWVFILLYGFRIRTAYDMQILILVMVAVTIEFSGLSIWKNLFSNGERLWNYLGRLSMYIYMSGILSNRLYKLIPFLKPYKKGITAHIYHVALTVLVGWFFMILCEFIRNPHRFSIKKPALSPPQFLSLQNTNNAKVSGLGKFFANISRYKAYMDYSAISALRADVSDSYLNWLWWIFDPLLFMMVYTFVSVVVFGSKEPHMIPFIFVGYSVWIFFSNCISQSVKIVRANKSILSRVYLPKYILLGSMLRENLIKYLISIVLCFIIALADHVHFSLYVLWFPVLVLCLMLLIFGLSCILLHLGVYLKDLSNIIRVILRLIMYLSGIFYNIVQRVPKPYGSLLLNMNPVAMYMNEMRNVILYQTAPRLKIIGIWVVISLLLCVIGIKLIHKYEQTYVKAI